MAVSRSGRGRPIPAAADWHNRCSLGHHPAISDRGPGLGLITGGETLGLVRWHPEGGVAHPERLEQPGAEELAEAHAGELFDEITSAPIVIISNSLDVFLTGEIVMVTPRAGL